MMNHHSIPNRHQLRRVCLFRCGTCCGWNKHFHPLSLFTSNTVAFVRISMMCVRVFVCFCLRVLLHALQGLYLFQTCGCTRVFACVDMLACACHMSLSVYCVVLLCLCQRLLVCKACYMKREVVEPSAGASEFICIHSTACLSSEPILITSSSGLLQRCVYSLSLSLSEKMGCWWCIPVALILLSL